MPLSNSQYDEIFRKYDEKQLASQHRLHGETVSPDGTPNVPLWDANTWVNTSIFTEEEWT